MIHSMASCCLRRLRASGESGGLRPGDRDDSGDFK